MTIDVRPHPKFPLLPLVGLRLMVILKITWNEILIKISIETEIFFLILVNSQNFKLWFKALCCPIWLCYSLITNVSGSNEWSIEFLAQRFSNTFSWAWSGMTSHTQTCWHPSVGFLDNLKVTAKLIMAQNKNWLTYKRTGKFCFPSLILKKFKLQIKMLLFNLIADFIDHQYYQKKLMDSSNFLYRNSHQRNDKTN